MPRVLVPLIDGFEEMEAIAPIDLLRRAGSEVHTAGIAKPTATGSHQITLQTDTLFADALPHDWDALVLPGGPGAKNLNAVPGLHDLIRRLHAQSRIVAAICAAPTVLHAAGILAGKRAACFPACEPQMAGTHILREPVVRDGNLITSRGAGTATPFALALVAALHGPQAADALASAIVWNH